MPFRGQWIGRYTGSNSGLVVLDVDRVGDQFVCVACAWDENINMPSTFIPSFNFPATEGASKEIASLRIQPINSRGMHLSADDLQRQNIVFPNTVSVRLQLHDNGLSLDWTSDIGGKGFTGVPLRRSGPSDPSATPSREVSWAEFKSIALQLPKSEFVFRGHQSSLWRLRTTFHRLNRFNIERFGGEDIPQLHQQFSGLSSLLLDMRDPNHHAAFINLAQHHGYPTPFLDWTWSPFVGAFFACRGLSQNAQSDSSRRIRIYKFAVRAWKEAEYKASSLFPAFPSITFIDNLPIGNNRLIPQRGISTYSNVDDIETYVLQRAETTGTRYLEAYDISCSSRQQIMTELDLMGINAGSMFPGFEGTCEAQRERCFFGV